MTLWINWIVQKKSGFISIESFAKRGAGEVTTPHVQHSNLLFSVVKRKLRESEAGYLVALFQQPLHHSSSTVLGDVTGFDSCIFVEHRGRRWVIIDCWSVISFAFQEQFVQPLTATALRDTATCVGRCACSSRHQFLVNRMLRTRLVITIFRDLLYNCTIFIVKSEIGLVL